MVGNVSEEAKALVKATYDSLMKSIEYCGPGKMYRGIGNIISAHCEPLGYGVVRTYCGHGVGQNLH